MSLGRTTESLCLTDNTVNHRRDGSRKVQAFIQGFLKTRSLNEEKKIKNLSKNFGALRVTDRVNLAFEAGRPRCIIGPNGTGKTTLFNLITGTIRPDKGEIFFDGRVITFLRPYESSRLGIIRKFKVPTVNIIRDTSQDVTTFVIDHDIPYEIARLGVAYVPQGRMTFPNLTVRENLKLGTTARKDKTKTIPEIVFEYFPRLKERLQQHGGTLSGGEQQMLAIGRGDPGSDQGPDEDGPGDGSDHPAGGAESGYGSGDGQQGLRHGEKGCVVVRGAVKEPQRDEIVKSHSTT